MKHFRILALTASLAAAMIPSGSVLAANNHPLRLTNSALEQQLSITLIGSFQGAITNLSFVDIEPQKMAERITAANLINAMAFDLVNSDTNLLNPSEIYFHNQITTNAISFLAASALYVRNEIITTQNSTNLVEGVVIRRGTNLIDVTGFFPDLFSTNGLEQVATNGPAQIQTSRTGSSLSFQGLRLLSFQSTNVSFTVTGFDTATSVKTPQIGTNFVHVISGAGVGTFEFNNGFIVSNALTLFTNVVLTNNLTFVTNIVPATNVITPVSGPAHAIVTLSGPTFRK